MTVEVALSLFVSFVSFASLKASLYYFSKIEDFKHQ